MISDSHDIYASKGGYYRLQRPLSSGATITNSERDDMSGRKRKVDCASCHRCRLCLPARSAPSRLTLMPPCQLASPCVHLVTPATCDKRAFPLRQDVKTCLAATTSSHLDTFRVSPVLDLVGVNSSNPVTNDLMIEPEEEIRNLSRIVAPIQSSVFLPGCRSPRVIVDL